LMMIDCEIDLPALLTEMQRRHDPWSGSMIGTFRLLAERQPSDCALAFARTDLPTSARVMLADALGGSGDYRILPVLSEAAMGQEPRIRAAGIKALGRLMHPACEPVLARGTLDKDATVRGASAIAIGDAGLTSLIPRLVGLLDDLQWWIRFQAAQSLTRLGPMGRNALHNAAAGADRAADMASLTLAELSL
jgi:HEAT repeat protein